MSTDKKKRSYKLTQPLLKLRELSGKVMEQKNKYGSFKGEPKAAAKKAYSGIIKSLLLEKKDHTNVQFSLKETTRGSAHKVYKWDGKCNKIPKTTIKKIQKKNGTIKEVITKDYNMDLEQISNDEQLNYTKKDEVIKDVIGDF